MRNILLVKHVQYWCKNTLEHKGLISPTSVKKTLTTTNSDEGVNPHPRSKERGSPDSVDSGI